jgi:tetratricopeptide (TPR) repeat protein
MRVSSQPSRIADRVRQIPGVNRVELWTVPWESELFVMTLAELAKSDPPPAVRARMAEDSLFLGRSPLSLGRSQHFRGRFANDDDRKGAKGHYLDTRIPDDVLDRLGNDESAQRAMGLVRDRFESDNAWINRLRVTQIISKTAKAHASYWLGLVHFETGQYDVAADWFRHRTLEVAGENPWKAGARYNLGRCLELQGKSVEARALYLEDKSTQRHGNMLRARLLLDTATVK